MRNLTVGVPAQLQDHAPDLQVARSDAPVSGGMIDVAGAFVPVPYPQPGDISLVDPDAEADWRRRASKQRRRVRRIRLIENGLVSAYAGLKGPVGQTVVLVVGLLVGLCLLGFGLLAQF